MSRANLSPLTWGIHIFVPPEPLETWTVSDPRSSRLMDLVKNAAASFGVGKYYVRGCLTYEAKSFWDDDIKSVNVENNVFCGLPLTMTVSMASNVVYIPIHWVNSFVQKHYGDLIHPAQCNIFLDDQLRVVYEAVVKVLSVRGNWLFKMDFKEQEANDSEPNHIDYSNHRIVAN